MILKRMSHCHDGIFSQLISPEGTRLAFTLEHAYLDNKGKWYAKIPLGTFRCVRGVHRLESMRDPFETFEVTGILGHSNILLHVGCFNHDSNGCILLGRAIQEFKGQLMITNSKDTFEKFMLANQNINEFPLEVI